MQYRGHKCQQKVVPIRNGKLTQ